MNDFALSRITGDPGELCDSEVLLMAEGMFTGVEHIEKEMRVYGKDILNTIPALWLALAAALVALIFFFLR